MNFVNREIKAELAGLSPDRSLARVLVDERKWPIRYDWIETIAIAFDVATITLASVCASVLYQLSEGMHVDLGQPIGSAALVSVLFTLFLKSQGQYRPTELLMWRRQIRLVFATWLGVFLLLAGIVFS